MLSKGSFQVKMKMISLRRQYQKIYNKQLVVVQDNNLISWLLAWFSTLVVSLHGLVLLIRSRRPSTAAV